MNHPILSTLSAAVQPDARPAPELGLSHKPAILVAVDFSPSAFATLSTAISVVGFMKGSLIVLHVEESGLSLLGRRVVEYLDDHRRRHRAHRARIRRVLGAALEELAGGRDLEVQIISVDGDPATEIVKTAFDFDADLIVVASGDRTGVAKALLGSTVDRIIHHASCPVLVARKKRSFLNLPPVPTHRSTPRDRPQQSEGMHTAITLLGLS